MPKPSHPLIETLRAATSPVLLTQLRSLFEGADDALFKMSERAPNEDSRKLHFATMRLLGRERRRMEIAFERAYADSFQPAGYAGGQGRESDEIDLDRFSVHATDELEERIAVGNLATKAENLHREALRDIARRLEFLIRNLGVPISRQAFAPETICAAFQSSTAGLDLELPVRLLLFKLFERFVASQFGQVYQAALQALDRQGIPSPASAGAPTRPPVAGFIHAPEVGAIPAAPLIHPDVDPETLRSLEGLAQSLNRYRPVDAQLAAELAACAVATPGTVPSARTVAVAQCLSLVGQMCNEILGDPHMPAAMRPLFERLRFPLIKISLADGSFFANRGHPVRRLLAEAAETAQTSRTGSPAVARQQEDRLRHIAEQIDLSAAFVRPQMDGLAPLPAAAIAEFLDQQRAESETRRETVLNKVRRAVAQELEVHTLGRTLPSPLTAFLRAGWGPLMAARLLRHGNNSRLWIDAVNRLVQILASMDALVLSSDLLAVRGELLDAVEEDLAEIGMRDERRSAVVEQLRRAYTELDERISRMTPAERATAELESFSASEHQLLMAEFPAPGSTSTRAPAPEARHEQRFESPADITLVSHQVNARDQKPPAPPPAPAAIPAPAAPAALPAIAPTPPIKPGARMPPDAAAAGDAQADLLARCLTAESWFRVFDAGSGQTLWLKVSRYYRAHDSVGFTGFDAKKTLSIRASRVLEDLIAGRTEPVNPSPAQLRALSELRSRNRGEAGGA